MKANILADRDVPAGVCACLRTYGHSVLEANARRLVRGEKGEDDDDVLRCAANDGRAVLTCNFLDFTTLAAQGASHEGIISCPAGRDERATADAIHRAIEQCLSVHPNLHMQVIKVGTQALRRRRQPPTRRGK